MIECSTKNKALGSLSSAEHGVNDVLVKGAAGGDLSVYRAILESLDSGVDAERNGRSCPG